MLKLSNWMRRIFAVTGRKRLRWVLSFLPKLPGDVPQAWFCDLPLIKTMLKCSNSSEPCELPCSESNNIHHISRSQTTHLIWTLFFFFFCSIRVILNICAFLSLFTAVIHAAPMPVVHNNNGTRLCKNHGPAGCPRSVLLIMVDHGILWLICNPRGRSSFAIGRAHKVGQRQLW